MTVQDLRAKLETFPQDAEVVFADSEYGYVVIGRVVRSPAGDVELMEEENAWERAHRTEVK